MEELPEQNPLASHARGEAAWREAQDRVAQRNAQARKAGKQRREALERNRVEHRRALEDAEMAGLLAAQGD
jgi:hypothetical protein